MTTPKTWKGVIKHLSTMPQEVQDYFEHFPRLAKEFPWEVSLSYLFGRVELAHNMVIYCGAVKLHGADSALARTAIENHHMTRDGFKKLFETIHGKQIPHAISKKIEESESVRDKVMHGKSATQNEQRQAIADVLDYARDFNEFVYNLSGLRPFDDLRGFKGRKQSLDKATSRWLLKGMGFNL